MDEESVEFNDGHILEGCDRLHVAMSTISAHIDDHPAIVKAGAQSDIEQALASLMEAYQKVGSLSE